MSEQAMDVAADLLARQMGMVLGPTARQRLTRHLQEEAERMGLELGTYVARLSEDSTAWQDLLNRITVQETSFFRDPDQFRLLTDHVLPQLEGPVHVWSAGCAYGQEPYSLAMALAECGVRDWHVYGSDISTAALARAQSGRYLERELRGLSPERRQRWLQRADNGWAVVPELRANVTLLHHNLLAGLPPFDMRACHVVFCRNVLIYIERAGWITLLARFATWLPPGAHLFLGTAETLWQISEHFEPIQIGGRTIYRRAPRGREVAAKPPVPTTARPAPVAAKPPAGPAASPPRPLDVAVPEHPEIQELLALGDAAFERRDYSAAVSAFRKVVYLAPNHPVAHLHQGLCFEEIGDAVAARRAYRAAQSAIARGGAAAIEVALEGYELNEVVELLEAKLVEVGD